MAGFKTKARAIDLLGEKQIADTTTAISELFKNAHDADAKRVVLGIDTQAQSLLLWDDGHGMSYEEILDKWLIIGTDSKLGDQENPVRYTESGERVTMGEKGIGRLAIAILGRQTLLITKRKGEPWAALYIHWGIFENGRLLLEHTSVPTAAYATRADVLAAIPQMKDELLDNLRRQDKDVQEAWALYPELRTRIEADIGNFDITHYDVEPVLRQIEAMDQGTMFYVNNLKGLLGAWRSGDDNAQDQHLELKRLVGNFVNSFELDEKRRTWREVLDFDPALEVDGVPHQVGTFDADDLARYDYGLDGTVRNGKFVGHFLVQGQQAKPTEFGVSKGMDAFRTQDCGPIRVRLLHVEGSARNSLLDYPVWEKITKKLERVGSIYLFRDHLRVLPYGEPNFDFLEIEATRSRDLGAFLFSHRRVFGYVEISKLTNPHLQDKSSREGLRDNDEFQYFLRSLKNLLWAWMELIEPHRSPKVQAVKAQSEAEKAKEQYRKDLAHYVRYYLKRQITQLRDSVQSESKVLEKAISERVPSNAHVYLAVKQSNANAKWTYLTLLESSHTLSRAVTEIRSRIGALGQGLQLDSRFAEESEVKYLAAEHQSHSEAKRAALRKLLDEKAGVSEQYLKQQLDAYYSTLSNQLNVETVDSFLRDLQDVVGHVRKNVENTHDEQLGVLTNRLALIVDAYTAILDRLGDEVRTRHTSVLSTASRAIDASFELAIGETSVVEDLFERFAEVSTENDYSSLAGRIQHAIVGVNDQLAHARQQSDLHIQDAEANYRVPVLDVFRSGSADSGEIARDFSENWGLINHLNTRIQEMTTQMERYRLLASTGIAAEVVNHEFEQQFSTLQKLFTQPAVRKSMETHPELKRLEELFRQLEGYYQLLSPLYQRTHVLREPMHLRNVAAHAEKFFMDKFALNRIEYQNQIPENFVVNESHATLLPVFINVINNSVYWMLDRQERVILLHGDAASRRLYLEDTGPGIDARNTDKVFDLFYSTRSDGRGIGLNLVRELLSSRNHKVRAVTGGEQKRLNGACIEIEFAANTVPGGAI